MQRLRGLQQPTEAPPDDTITPIAIKEDHLSIHFTCDQNRTVLMSCAHDNEAFTVTLGAVGGGPQLDIPFPSTNYARPPLPPAYSTMQRSKGETEHIVGGSGTKSRAGTPTTNVVVSADGPRGAVIKLRQHEVIS
ncbi:hypothetical protein ACJJTC_007308 [Scirpophaga incertulas]